jgi:hypothetical protein
LYECTPPAAALAIFLIDSAWVVNSFPLFLAEVLVRSPVQTPRLSHEILGGVSTVPKIHVQWQAARNIRQCGADGEGHTSALLDTKVAKNPLHCAAQHCFCLQYVTARQSTSRHVTARRCRTKRVAFVYKHARTIAIFKLVSVPKKRSGFDCLFSPEHNK